MRATRAIAVAVVLVAGLACGGPKEDPILRLSAEESLEIGKQLMEEEKYLRARDYLTHAFEVEPNSLSGREALLLAADALYLEGGESNYIQAEAKYRDFQNRFPTSARSDYVQYQVARTLLERMEKPDRDQSTTRRAMEAFRDLIALFPTSEYVEEARQQIRVVEDNLAEHEYMIGHFYLRFRLPTATVSRLEYLLENYPNYSDKAKVYLDLGVAYSRTGKRDEAAAMFDRLRAEYPDSELISEIPKLPAPKPQTADETSQSGDDAAASAADAATSGAGS